MILSIESSCDDSSLALTCAKTCALLWHKKISQDKELCAYGGVVPELASRLHAQNLPGILDELVRFCNARFGVEKSPSARHCETSRSGSPCYTGSHNDGRTLESSLRASERSERSEPRSIHSSNPSNASPSLNAIDCHATQTSSASLAMTALEESTSGLSSGLPCCARSHNDDRTLESSLRASGRSERSEPRSIHSSNPSNASPSLNVIDCHATQTSSASLAMTNERAGNLALKTIKAVAVTTHPGLSVTLIEGLAMAKTIALTLGIPLIALNHLKGHIYSLLINNNASLESLAPMAVLLVSGGHTQILEVRSFSQIFLVSSTLDDSFGESFDKVAKMLGLLNNVDSKSAISGGAMVEKTAKNAKDPTPFTIPLQHKNTLDFSFSGLKNAVRLAVESAQDSGALDDAMRANICAGFQHAAIKHVVQKFNKFMKLRRESKEPKIKNIAIVGGASANKNLRGEFEKIARVFGANLLLAELKFCADNAAMMGRLAVEHFRRGAFVSDPEEFNSIAITPRTNEFLRYSFEQDFKQDSAAPKE